jgi:hypothetical protein
MVGSTTTTKVAETTQVGCVNGNTSTRATNMLVKDRRPRGLCSVSDCTLGILVVADDD